MTKKIKAHTNIITYVTFLPYILKILKEPLRENLFIYTVYA